MLQNDGGIGGYFGGVRSAYTAYQGELTGQVNIDYDRVIFDNLFNIIVLVLLMEILAGIIIDKFVDLRQNQEFIFEDSSNKCFICGQSREILEKYYGKNGFYTHVRVCKEIVAIK